MTSSTPAIPVIDFARYREAAPAGRAALAAEVGHACGVYGFFYLRNHGVPKKITQSAFEQAHWYFSQPMATKLELAQTPDNANGYIRPFRDEVAGIASAMEYFMMMEDLCAAPGQEIASPLHQRNRWPAGNTVFRPVMTEYFRAYMGLARELLEVFSLALGLDSGRIGRLYQQPIVNLQLNHYRGQAEPDAREVGVGAHRDKGGFTILVTDEVGGLEVKGPDGGWITAPFLPETVIVNVGNMLMLQTNNRFTSVVHRVINATQRPRFSIPLFLNPDWEASVAPEPELVTPENPSRYSQPLQFGPWFHRTVYGSKYNTRDDITIAFTD